MKATDLKKLPIILFSEKTNKDNAEFPLKYISYSSMVKFCTNPLLFKIKSINGDIIDTAMGASGILGQAFHHAMEIYQGGNDSYPITSEKEAIEMGLKGGMEFLEAYNDGFISFSKTIPNKQKLFDLLSFCFNSYIQEVSYNNKNVSVEEEIHKDISVSWNGTNISLPIPLKGYLDLIIEDDDGEFIIKDYKTCYTFSDPEKIDGAKIIQSVIYFLLVFAKYGKTPKKLVFEEVKYTKNSSGGNQVQRYEIIYEDNPLYFDFFFRLYEDMIRALNGEMVYVPNLDARYDNEVAIISYIHRLDIPEEQAKIFKKNKVTNITDLLKKEIQTASNMRALMKAVENSLVEAKSIDYSNMKIEEKIQTKMMEHGMIIKFDSVIHGASVDLYRFTPSIGLKMSRIRNYVDDIQQVLGAKSIRVLAPIPATTLIGFEVSKEDRTYPKVPKMEKGGFNIAIGQDVYGKDRRFDIRTAPHILISGTSGSGKSVLLNTLIDQIVQIPEAELHLFDPKFVELFNWSKHKNVIEYRDNSVEISKALSKMVTLMDKRYKEMKELGLKNNESGHFPYKFIIIDEYADLSMREDVSSSIQYLAQKGRACGIHLIISTQRASTKIIQGDIKVNFPCRIVLKMDKEASSRVMLDEGGAEKLLGKGDLLFLADNGIERLQGYLC